MMVQLRSNQFEPKNETYTTYDLLQLTKKTWKTYYEQHEIQKKYKKDLVVEEPWL